MKKHLTKILLLFLVIFIGSCGKQDEEENQDAGLLTLSSIAISPVNSNSPINTITEFKTRAVYSNQLNREITPTWNSSDETVATIDVKGIVKALAIGSTTITATSSNKTASTILTITQELPITIKIIPDNPTIKWPQTQQFNVIGSYLSDIKYDLISAKVTWSSSDQTAASISTTGLMKILSNAPITITAEIENITTTTSLIVNLLESITITPKEPILTIGLTQQFNAKGTYADQTNEELSSSVIWSSSDETIVTINSTGLAKGITEGSVTISAQGGSIVGTNILNVSAIESITITPEDPVIQTGKTLQFKVTGLYSNGKEQNIVTGINWTSSEPSIATIDADGLVTALSKGLTMITAKKGFISHTVILQVK